MHIQHTYHTWTFQFGYIYKNMLPCKKGVNSPSPKRVFPLVPRLEGAGMYWLNHDTNIKEGTVDWRNPANQLIGSLSSHDLQILQGFIHSKWCIFFPATVPLETMFNSCNLFFLWRCMSLLRRGIGRNNLHSIELADSLKTSQSRPPSLDDHLNCIWMIQLGWACDDKNMFF